MNKIMWQFIGMCILFTVIPTVIIGKGHLTIYGVEMFTLLSLIIPLMMKKVERLRFATGFHMRLYYHAYAWLLWTVFFFLGSGTMHLVIPVKNIALIGALWVVVLSCVMTIIILSGVLLTRFFERQKRHEWFHTTLDIAAVTLPLPILLMGGVLYIDNPMLVQAYMSFMYDYIKLCLLLLLVITMAAMAIYLYPRGETPKKTRFVRIFVTALVWLAIVGHVMFGWMPQFVLQAVKVVFPVYQGSLLVYVTPAIILLIILAVAVGAGLYSEYYLLKYRHKRRMNMTSIDR